MSALVTMGPIRDLWFKWKMLKLPWRKSFLIGKDAPPLLRKCSASSNSLQAKTFKAIPSGSSTTNSMQAAFAALYDTTAKLISQISRLLRNGTSGYDKRVTILRAYKSNKLMLGGKHS